jgi:hypothetical protein
VGCSEGVLTQSVDFTQHPLRGAEGNPISAVDRTG